MEWAVILGLCNSVCIVGLALSSIGLNRAFRDLLEIVRGMVRRLP